MHFDDIQKVVRKLRRINTKRKPLYLRVLDPGSVFQERYATWNRWTALLNAFRAMKVQHYGMSETPFTTGQRSPLSDLKGLKICWLFLCVSHLYGGRLDAEVVDDEGRRAAGGRTAGGAAGVDHRYIN